MLPENNTILEFFEQMSLDDKAYFSFTNEESLQVCVSYLKKYDNRNWTLWFKSNESASKQTISGQHLFAVLKGFKIDETYFCKELSGTLLMQAAYADEFIRQTTELFGKRAIQKTILEAQNFMDALAEQIQKIVAEKESIDKLKKLKIKSKNKNIFKIIK